MQRPLARPPPLGRFDPAPARLGGVPADLRTRWLPAGAGFGDAVGPGPGAARYRLSAPGPGQPPYRRRVRADPGRLALGIRPARGVARGGAAAPATGLP